MFNYFSFLTDLTLLLLLFSVLKQVFIFIFLMEKYIFVYIWWIGIREGGGLLRGTMALVHFPLFYFILIFDF